MRKFVDRWKSDAFKNANISKTIYTDLKKKLLIGYHPYSGWRSIPNQNLNTISINSHGLRSKEITKLDKTKKNCLLFGGSVAWGFGASSNDFTPSALIEKYLNNNYNLNYNVINLADQMQSSYEELNTFINCIDELNPDIVIFLSGTNDIHRSFNNNYFKFTQFSQNIANNYLKFLSKGLINEENPIKFILKYIFRFNKKTFIYKNNNFLFNKPINDIANKLFSKKVEIVDKICVDKKIKVFHFLQPDLILKKNKSKSEEKYYNFVGQEKKDHIKSCLNKFTKDFFYKKRIVNNKTCYISLLDIFDNNSETIYFDQAHITDFGNNLIAEKIAIEINFFLNNNE